MVICPSVMDGYLSQCEGWLFAMSVSSQLWMRSDLDKHDRDRIHVLQ